jgi:hypothetical protein
LPLVNFFFLLANIKGDAGLLFVMSSDEEKQLEALDKRLAQLNHERQQLVSKIQEGENAKLAAAFTAQSVKREKGTKLRKLQLKYPAGDEIEGQDAADIIELAPREWYRQMDGAVCWKKEFSMYPKQPEPLAWRPDESHLGHYPKPFGAV